uniref:Zn(2)-C6 fungal-type domain-containing protein n=1 Tax=Mycena chlorophos TaxID=658473 RepID=A0ABQ0LAF0_MYCCL|nr:predicted protein [Mycena chlorophos]
MASAAPHPRIRTAKLPGSANLKCIPTDSDAAQSSGCERCRRRHLHCDLEKPRENTLGLVFPSPQYASLGTANTGPGINSSSPLALADHREFFTPISESASSSSSSFVSGRLPLPYTRAPPRDARPRYSDGAPYPDLRLPSAADAGPNSSFIDDRETRALQQSPVSLDTAMGISAAAGYLIPSFR